MFDSTRYLLISYFNKAFEVFSTYLNANKSEKQTMFQTEAVIKICLSILQYKVGLG